MDRTEIEARIDEILATGDVPGAFDFVRRQVVDGSLTAADRAAVVAAKLGPGSILPTSGVTLRRHYVAQANAAARGKDWIKAFRLVSEAEDFGLVTSAEAAKLRGLIAEGRLVEETREKGMGTTGLKASAAAWRQALAGLSKVVVILILVAAVVWVISMARFAGSIVPGGFSSGGGARVWLSLLATFTKPLIMLIVAIVGLVIWLIAFLKKK